MNNMVSIYSVDQDLMDRLVRYFIIFDYNKFSISDEFYANYLSYFTNKHLSNDFILDGTTTFEDLFIGTNTFIKNLHTFNNVLGHHLAFPYQRSVVYKFLNFCIDTRNIKLRLQQLSSFMKNDEDICQNHSFVNFVLEITKLLVPKLRERKRFEWLDCEDLHCLAIFFKQVNLAYSILVSSNHLSSCFSDVIQNPHKVDECYDKVYTSLVSVVEKIPVVKTHNSYIIDGESVDLNFDTLKYPIHDVKIFEKQKLFQPKRVYIFIGAAGIGKSMLLSHIAGEYLIENTERRSDNHEIIFYFTFENTDRETAMRVYANSFYRLGMQYTIDDIVTGNVPEASKEVLKKKIRNNNRSLVIVYLEPGLYSTKTLIGYIEKGMVEKNGVPYAILIDYIDEMRSDNSSLRRSNVPEHQELGEILHDFKALSLKYDVPVITVSHLNADGCRVLREDIEKLGSHNVGKSIRKYERSDVVCFVDVEDVGMDFKEMTLFFSKHRYANVQKISKKKFLPEYAFIDFLSKSDINNIKNQDLDGFEIDGL